LLLAENSLHALNIASFFARHPVIHTIKHSPPLFMKFSRFFPAALLLLFVVAVIAPACSRKSGCPQATHASDVFSKDAKKKSKRN